MREDVAKAQTRMLRNSPRLIRDFWFEGDKEEPAKQVLVLRQIKSLENGDISCKIMRLAEWECAILDKVMREKFSNLSQS